MARQLAYITCVGIAVFVVPGCAAVLGGPCICGDDEPNWSPDGKTIVYSHNDEGKDSHVYVVSSGGGKPTRLTAHGDDYTPVWAPDGSKIAFIRSSSSSIMVMDADGSNERQVAINADGPVLWSPDGKRLAFWGDGQALRVVRVEGESELSGTRVSPGSVLPDGFDWAPDGRLAFVSNGQIYVARPGGLPERLSNQAGRHPKKPAATASTRRAARLLVKDDFSDRGSGWETRTGDFGSVGYSQGAYRILVSRDGDVSGTLWLQSAVQAVEIEADVTERRGPKSSESQGIVCWASRNRRSGYEFDIGPAAKFYGIVRLAPAGRGYVLSQGDIPNLLRGIGQSNHIRADCTSGGAGSVRIAFYVNGTRVANLVEAGGYGRFVGIGLTVGSPGGATEALFDNVVAMQPRTAATQPGAGAEDSLDWSPDGRKIAFVSADQVFAMNVDGSGIRKLSGSHSTSSQPNWSPDGKLIAWLKDGTIMVANGDGSGRRELPYSKSQYTQYTFAWAPDSKRIVFSAVAVHPKSEGEDALFIVEVAHPNRLTPLTN